MPPCFLQFPYSLPAGDKTHKSYLYLLDIYATVPP